MSDLITITDPSTPETLGEVAASTQAETEAAVLAAADVLESAERRNAARRAAVLRDWAALVQAHAGELADALVAQTGKLVTGACREAASCAATLDYYAGLARYVGGRAGTVTDRSEAHLVREPVGVTAFITPYS
jgi:betaine-aldehyde dehydrogenase